MITPMKKLSLFLMNHLLSGNGKRIVFLTTTYIKLHRESRTCPAKLEELNKRLHIARHVDALELPARMCDMVWGKDDLEKAVCASCGMQRCNLITCNLSESNLKRACQAIVDAAPSWLRYGRQSDMIDDMVNLVREANREWACA